MKNVRKWNVYKSGGEGIRQREQPVQKLYVHLRLEGMEGSVAREYELGEKGGNEVTQIM